MRKRIFSAILILTMITILVLPIPGTFAGSKNQNGENGIQGTDKINGKEGCRAMGGMKAVDLGELFESIMGYRYVWGKACCASNILVETVDVEGEDTQVFEPNQCCNGPDFIPTPGGPIPSGEYAPGNHCLCFTLNGYAPVLE